jgi:hypothetical protein
MNKDLSTLILNYMKPGFRYTMRNILNQFAYSGLYPHEISREVHKHVSKGLIDLRSGYFIKPIESC